MKKVAQKIFLLSTFVGSSAVCAAPLTWEETADGDLEASRILAFGVGANTVAGNIFLEVADGELVGADIDPFQFTLPSGSELTSIAYTTTGSATSTGVKSDFDVIVSGGLLFLIVQQTLDGVHSGTYFDGSMPLSDGPTYLSGYTTLDASGIPTYVNTMGYTLTYNVVSVPLPATAWLFLSALGGLGIIKRKQG